MERSQFTLISFLNNTTALAYVTPGEEVNDIEYDAPCECTITFQSHGDIWRFNFVFEKKRTKKSAGGTLAPERLHGIVLNLSPQILDDFESFELSDFKQIPNAKMSDYIGCV
ncbi:hypothetical protein [Roseibium aggregatum]|uniref:hypothetical protein n=1 Tax=Roseibium aggregatum TaxID=187304 RepID=UPI001E460C09|nr:hypothetical protein [Roseibium aggregatum]UES54001.1 hypothetical protein GFK88_29920 [Roseibium aggregatum]